MNTIGRWTATMIVITAALLFIGDSILHSRYLQSLSMWWPLVIVLLAHEYMFQFMNSGKKPEGLHLSSLAQSILFTIVLVWIQRHFAAF